MVLFNKLLLPIPILLDPDKLLYNDKTPYAELFSPVVLLHNDSLPYFVIVLG